MEVEFTDRQLLKYLKQARTATGGQEWRNKKNTLKLQEPKHLNQTMDWRCLWNLKNLTQKQTWLQKELSYENINCLSQRFNNDCSWCEKKHQSMPKNGKGVSKHISFLVIKLKNLSHKYQSTTLILKIFAWIYNNFDRYSNKWEGSNNIWYKANKVLNSNTTKASFNQAI